MVFVRIHNCRTPSIHELFIISQFHCGKGCCLCFYGSRTVTALKMWQSRGNWSLGPSCWAIEMCCVCGRDVHLWQDFGRDEDPILGHEMVGRIVAFWRRAMVSVGQALRNL